MTVAVFVAAYAIIAMAVGGAYFAYQQWPEFLDSHDLAEDARDCVMLHLTIGAAAVGAAWPVAIVFLAYGIYASLARRIAAQRADA